MTTGKILSARYGFIGPPSIVGQNIPKGTGSLSPIIGIVSGEASRIYSVGIFSPTISMIGTGAKIFTATGDFTSPIYRRIVGRARTLGDSWVDWFRNYQGN